MTDCCNDKACEVEHLRARQGATLTAVFAVNAGMFLVEAVAGLLRDSISLLADSLDMLGDALVYGVSLYVIARGEKAKAIAALCKGIVMAGFGLFVLAQTTYRLLVPEMPAVEVMGLVGFLALAGNATCLALLWRHRADDINMRSLFA